MDQFLKIFLILRAHKISVPSLYLTFPKPHFRQSIIRQNIHAMLPPFDLDTKLGEVISWTDLKRPCPYDDRNDIWQYYYIDGWKNTRAIKLMPLCLNEGML